MTSDIINSLNISAAGMRSQGARVRVISQNVANANTLGTTPGADPYRRQTISFKNELNKELGVKTVRVDRVDQDMNTPFPTKFMPEHPAADENGLVKTPNVNTLVEMMDIKEAQRSYEANLSMIEQAKAMANRTVDLLRSQ